MGTESVLVTLRAKRVFSCSSCNTNPTYSNQTMVRRRSLSRSEIIAKKSQKRASIGRDGDMSVPATSGKRANKKNMPQVLEIVDSADETENQINTTFEVKTPAKKALKSMKDDVLAEEVEAEGVDESEEGEEVDTDADAPVAEEVKKVSQSAAKKAAKTVKTPKSAKAVVSQSKKTTSDEEIRKSTRVKMPIQYYAALPFGAMKGSKRKAPSTKDVEKNPKMAKKSDTEGPAVAKKPALAKDFDLSEEDEVDSADEGVADKVEGKKTPSKAMPKKAAKTKAEPKKKAMEMKEKAASKKSKPEPKAAKAMKEKSEPKKTKAETKKEKEEMKKASAEPVNDKKKTPQKKTKKQGSEAESEVPKKRGAPKKIKS